MDLRICKNEGCENPLTTTSSSCFREGICVGCNSKKDRDELVARVELICKIFAEHPDEFSLCPTDPFPGRECSGIRPVYGEEYDQEFKKFIAYVARKQYGNADMCLIAMGYIYYKDSNNKIALYGGGEGFSMDKLRAMANKT